MAVHGRTLSFDELLRTVVGTARAPLFPVDLAEPRVSASPAVGLDRYEFRNDTSTWADCGSSEFLLDRKVDHVVQPIHGDGNCFFRAVAMALEQTDRGFRAIKRHIANKIEPEQFRAYVLDYRMNMGRIPDHSSDFVVWQREWPESNEWATQCHSFYCATS